MKIIGRPIPTDSIGSKRKLLTQVTLDKWFTWANEYDSRIFTLQERGGYRARWKVKAYNIFIGQLKEDQQKQLEEELWHEIHGD